MNHWWEPLFKFYLILALLLSLSLIPASGMGEKPVISAPEYRHAYALRYDEKKLLGVSYNVAYLDKIDTISDEVVSSTQVDDGYNSVSVLDNRYLILCNTQGEHEGAYTGADIFDTEKEEFVTGLKTDGGYPSFGFPVNEEIFVITTKHRYENHPIKGTIIVTWTSLEIFDRYNYHKIKGLDTREDDRVLEEFSINQDKTKLYFIAWNAGYHPKDSNGLIGMIDLKTNTLIKSITETSYFGGGRWIAVVGDKLYATAVEATSKEGLKPSNKRIPNPYLFVFDANDLTLKKKIPIGLFAEQLTYVPSVNRLYIAHSSWDERTPPYIEVLDCATDKVIAKIPVKGFRRMAYVGNNKLYVSHSGGVLFGSDGRGGLLSIDVRTNKILKNIPGEYAPVGYNFNL